MTELDIKSYRGAALRRIHAMLRSVSYYRQRRQQAPGDAGKELMQQKVVSLCTKLLICVGLVLCSSSIFWGALTLGIDGDEGFYVFASRLVLEGKTPYLDFMYPQMPLLPYVYAGWFSAFGTSWLSARMCTALLGFGVITLLYSHLKPSQGTSGALLAAIIVGFSSLTVPWLAVTKTYALTAFLLMAAYWAHMRRYRGAGDLILVLSGVCFGLAISSRLMVAPCGLVFLWYVWKREKIAAVLLWLGSVFVGVLPAIALWAKAPAAFWFNNLGYHGLRSHASWSFQWEKKQALLQLLFGLDGRFTGAGLQFLLLVVLASFYFFWTMRRLRTLDPAAGLVFCLFVVNVLPNPAFTQYFVLLVPFLAILATTWLSEMLERAQASGGWARSISVMVLAAVGLAIYCMSPHFTLRPFVQLASASDGANLLRQHKESAGPVLSFWPGFLLETERESLPGFENHFALRVASLLSEKERAEYKLATFTDARNAIAARTPGAIVAPIPLLQKGSGGKKLRTWISESGYRPIGDIEGYRFFARSEP
jgi:hypothetical protein